MEQNNSKPKNTTRKRCKKNEYWVKEAEKCMTKEDKATFLENFKKEKKLAKEQEKAQKKEIILEEEKREDEQGEEKTSFLQTVTGLFSSEPKEITKKKRKTQKKRVSVKPKEQEKPLDMYEPKQDISPEMKQDEITTFPGVSVKKQSKKVPVADLENQAQLKKERQTFQSNQPVENSFYPDKNDPNFNLKIAEKKEFNDLIKNEDTRKDDVEKFADKECKSGFQILPHQQFVKNFISIHTPFNSLLLYHELGTGKTCSAIGVAEELRKYMKRSGVVRKTIVVGNHNILSNFRLQLFDPNKLKEDGKKGLWSLDTCVGSSLIEEVNEFHYEGKTREQVSKQINHIIDTYYEFVGYRKLANLIESKMDIDLNKLRDVHDTDTDLIRKKKVLEINRVRKVFDNTLFIIDEAHNILQRDENKRKRAAKMLVKLAKYCENIKFLLLSATPMYNTHQELVWLVNLMNINDRRPVIKPSDVFLQDGQFVSGKKGEDDVVIEEDGKTLLKRKLIGYVSYVRGENPYVFPFRIYPTSFADSDNLLSNVSYPTHVMTDVPLNGQRIEHLDLFIHRFASYQQIIYERLIEYTVEQKRQLPNFEESSSFAIKWLLPLISTTNMTYPQDKVIEIENNKGNMTEITDYTLSTCHGVNGLLNVMNRKEEAYDDKTSYIQFEYKKDTLSNYGRIFQEPQLSKYSAKISKICNCIKNSKGIILIYSNYLDAGLIPMALALEEMGIKRYCRREYMPTSMLQVDNNDDGNHNQGKYIMITGSMTYSPSNKEDIEQVVQPNNKYGDNVRVVLVSGSGSEGIDLKNVRQVHILEPWYNLNRIEQVIGRAVRNKSHCALPFKERNVEIYMHTSYLNTKEETVDMYLYRVAEKKALNIGVLSRMLKETAVDCLIYNNESQNYTKEHLNTKVSLLLSTDDKQIEHEIGDKPYSHTCDYMEKCSYTCSPDTDMKKIKVKKNTYHTDHLQSNHNRIIKRIRQLFRDNVFYSANDIVKNINIGRPYMLEEIYYTLSQMLDNRNIWLVNKGRIGYLIESKGTYTFQTSEYTDLQATVYERKKAVDTKRDKILYELPTDGSVIDFDEEESDEEVINEREKKEEEVIVQPHEPGKSEKHFKDPKSVELLTKVFSQDPKLNMKEEESLPLEDMKTTSTDLTVFRNCFQFMSKTPRKIFNRNIDRKEDTWYICAPLAIKSLMQDHGASLTQVCMYAVSHILETMIFERKMNFVRKYYTSDDAFVTVNTSDINVQDLKDISDETFDTFIKVHLQKSIYFPKSSTELPHVYMTQNTTNHHYVFENGKWDKAGVAFRENYLYVQQWLKSFDKKGNIKNKIHNDFQGLEFTEKDTCIIGFMGLIKLNESNGYDFKIKNILNSSLANKGVRCINKIKSEILSFLNDTLISIENKTIYDGYKIDKVEFETRELVCLYELLLRHLNETTEQTWFLTMEECTESAFQNTVFEKKKDASGKNILVEKTKN